MDVVLTPIYEKSQVYWPLKDTPFRRQTQPAPRTFKGVSVHGIFAGILLPQARPASRDSFLSQTTLARKKCRALVILRWNSVPERTRAAVGRRRDEGALLRLRTGPGPRKVTARESRGALEAGLPACSRAPENSQVTRGGGEWDWAGRSLLTDSSLRDTSERPGCSRVMCC